MARAHGSEVNNVSFQPNARSELIINIRPADLRDRLLRDPILCDAIYANALRQILGYIFTDPADEEEDWFQDWCTFITTLCGPDIVGELDDEELRDEAIDKLVTAFAERRRYVERALKLQKIRTDE